MRPVVLSALRLHLFTFLMSVLSWCFFTTKCFLLTNTLLFIIGVIYCNTAHSCLMMWWTGTWLFMFVQNHFVFMLQVSLGFFGFKFDVVRLVWAQISPGKDEENISFWFHHHKHGRKTSGRLVISGGFTWMNVGTPFWTAVSGNDVFGWKTSWLLIRNIKWCQI